MPEPVTSPADAQSRQILAGGQTEQSPDSLVELEGGKAGSRREIGNAQRRVEMVGDVGERCGKPLGDRTRPR